MSEQDRDWLALALRDAGIAIGAVGWDWPRMASLLLRAGVSPSTGDDHKTPHPLAFHDDCVACLRQRIREMNEGAAQKARDLRPPSTGDDRLREALHRRVELAMTVADGPFDRRELVHAAIDEVLATPAPKPEEPR